MNEHKTELAPQPTTVCVAYSADGSEHRVHVARLGSVEDLAKLNKSFKNGAKLISGWATNNGGTSVSNEQSAGIVCVPAKALATLQDLVRQYEAAVDQTCSVGIGITAQNAYDACRYSSLKGGDQTTIFDKKIAVELKEMAEDKEESSKESSLMKAAHEHHTGGGGKQVYAGVGVSHNPEEQAQKQVDTGLKVQAPAKSRAASHHAISFSQIKDPGKQAGGVGAPSPAEARPSGPPQQEKQAPDPGPTEAPKEAHEGSEDLDSVKQNIAKALEAIHDQMADIVVLKQHAPKTYKAIVSVVEGLISLGKLVAAKGDSMQKSDAGAGVGGDIGTQSQSPGAGGLGDDASLYKQELDASLIDEAQLAIAIQKEFTEHHDMAIARKVAIDHLRANPDHYKGLLKSKVPSVFNKFSPEQDLHDVSPRPSEDPSK